MVNRHPFTNVAGAGGILSFCVQQWLQQYFSQGWQNVPWGWLGAILIAIWLGAQIRQFERGEHWLQAWVAKRRQRLLFAGIKYDMHQADSTLHATVEAGVARSIKNASARLDVFTLRHDGGQTQWNERAGNWVKIRRAKIFSHKDLNRGDFFHLPVFVTGDLASPDAKTTNELAVSTEGFYKCVVSVTSAKGGPIQQSYDFYLIEAGPGRGGALVQLPMVTPNEGRWIGDGLDYLEVTYDPPKREVRQLAPADGAGRAA
jgi:hypothetical protein